MTNSKRGFTAPAYITKWRYIMTTQLQLRRQGARMSQSELARKAEISVRTLQSLETGARNIDKVAVLTALKLARALECNIEDILDWSE